MGVGVESKIRRILRNIMLLVLIMCYSVGCGAPAEAPESGDGSAGYVINTSATQSEEQAVSEETQIYTAPLETIDDEELRAIRDKLVREGFYYDFVWEGTPVYSLCSGHVEFSEWDYGTENGITVRIADTNGAVWEYRHLSEKNVIADTEVKLGDIIGYTGATGSATHMCLEIVLNDYPGYKNHADYTLAQMRETVLEEGIYHAYTDFGKPIYSLSGGVVISDIWDGMYQRTVTVLDDNGYCWRYEHLYDVFISEGARVVYGEKIGTASYTPCTRDASVTVKCKKD